MAISIDRVVAALTDLIETCKDLPGDLRSIVDQQYAQVQEAHDHIRMVQKINMKYRTDKPFFNYKI